MTSVSSSQRIHATATVHPRAEIHPTAEVGPGCAIGEHVRIGASTKLYPNVVVDGWTEIGAENLIYPGVAIGLEPQDLKYRGAPSRVEIGDRNCLRECVTINRATEEGEVTRLGNDNLLMAYTHVAHNCDIGDRVIMANSVALAGHIRIESQARISGLVGVHQFTHIGKLAMVGGMARIDRDVPPYMMVEGNPGRIRGLNLVGLKRAGLRSSDPEFKQLKEAYRLLYRSRRKLEDVLQELATWPSEGEYVAELLRFLKSSIGDRDRRGPLPSRDTDKKGEA
ncbi:acyl-ACP--UDP-N-acetylglucosamine O-acyltransferase [Synechococcus sp. PCC 7336]|uniref:acyl-ACP--UDP-N-acetylglucosamine O-acyltransferase n=1 Tax=Synechococcus sp. PCC 7336 TaxID=195250 RepID=UPI00034D89BE|nr:acyl-ACP--UDP-N-acetylglucosamine O-acyltransferase [Synechococcus sp. PCC 7336]